MFPWLNHNAGAMQALLAAASLVVAIVLAVITYTYVRLTRRIVDESRNTYMNAAMPLITVVLKKYSGLPGPTNVHFELELINIGVGPAVQIKVLLGAEVRDVLRIISSLLQSNHALGEKQTLLLGVKPSDDLIGQDITPLLRDRDIVVQIRYEDVYGRSFASEVIVRPNKSETLPQKVFIASMTYSAPTIPDAASSASPKFPDPPVAPVPAASEDH